MDLPSDEACLPDAVYGSEDIINHNMIVMRQDESKTGFQLKRLQFPGTIDWGGDPAREHRMTLTLPNTLLPIAPANVVMTSR